MTTHGTNAAVLSAAASPPESANSSNVSRRARPAAKSATTLTPASALATSPSGRIAW